MKVLECPTHGKACQKTRVFSEQLAGPSGLGEDEPFAFLGCWLRMGEDRDRFPDAKSHGSGWRKGPSVEEVKAYAKDMGWLPSEEGPGP